MSRSWSALPLAALLALAACKDSSKIEIDASERRDAYPSGQLSCEIRGTIRNNTEAEIRWVEFDLIAGRARGATRLAGSNISAGGQRQFGVWFVGTPCANLPNRLGIEVSRCRLVGDRDCTNSVALRR